MKAQNADISLFIRNFASVTMVWLGFIRLVICGAGASGADSFLSERAFPLRLCGFSEPEKPWKHHTSRLKHDYYKFKGICNKLLPKRSLLLSFLSYYLV